MLLIRTSKGSCKGLCVNKSFYIYWKELSDRVWFRNTEQNGRNRPLYLAEVESRNFFLAPAPTFLNKKPAAENNILQKTI